VIYLFPFPPLLSSPNSKRELQASTWPAIFDDEWGVRKFYVYENGKMVAFIWWLPCWRDGKVVGYTANCPRRDTDKTTITCHSYVLDYAFLACADIFKSEGLEFAALGGAYGVEMEKEKGDSAVVRHLGKWAVNNMSYFYNLKGVSDHKERYKSNRTPKLYACHKGPYSEMVYLILPYIATEAIPHLSTGLFGKGVFIHKHNPNQEFLPVEDVSIQTSTTTTTIPTSTTVPSSSQPEGVVQQKKNKKDKKKQANKNKAPKQQQEKQQHAAVKQQKQQQKKVLDDKVVAPQKLSRKALSNLSGFLSEMSTHRIKRSDSQRTISCIEDEAREEMEASMDCLVAVQ